MTLQVPADAFKGFTDGDISREELNEMESLIDLLEKESAAPPAAATDPLTTGAMMVGGGIIAGLAGEAAYRGYTAAMDAPKCIFNYVHFCSSSNPQYSTEAGFFFIVPWRL